MYFSFGRVIWSKHNEFVLKPLCLYVPASRTSNDSGKWLKAVPDEASAPLEVLRKDKNNWYFMGTCKTTVVRCDSYDIDNGLCERVRC